MTYRRVVEALSRALSVLFLLAALMPVSLAHAASPTPAPATGVWIAKCDDEASRASCQLVQYAALRLGEAPLFMVTISRDAKTGKRFGIVTAPLRVYLAPGVRIVVDRKRPFKAAFELCDEAGCHAGFRFEGAVADAFRKGSRAEISVWTAKDKAVVFPLALNGLSAALETFEGAKNP
ncbi:MAG: invasion associated locus B family protein [Proteobacteria bacterium]|nr:invasion associated locus B family protein [Pseudomonadota bacterium]